MSRLSEQLSRGQFVVTAEIAPPKGTNLAPALAAAARFSGITAVNVTDNQGANMRLSALALAARLQQAGTETILQLTCRPARCGRLWHREPAAAVWRSQ
jgi:5,10-methylenetetrahydrofolate reductase